MITLINGDSHTAGSIPTICDYDHSMAWPRWLCDSINSQYLNISEPANGNEQIFRSTILSVGQLLTQRPADSILVLVMWSGFKRYEFWDGDRHRSYSLQSTFPVNEKFKNYVDSKSSIESDSYVYYKMLFYMYTLALVLESHGVKYQFMNTSKTMPEPYAIDDENLKAEYLRVYNLYGDRKNNHIGFHDEDNTYFGYLKNIKPAVSLPHPYWGEEGHKAYANFVQKRLDFNQIVPYNRC
jgi:hypothetical protein